MTIRVPKENVLDNILKILGKERKIIIPEEAGKIYKAMGPYVQIKGKRESFIKALFRKNR